MLLRLTLHHLFVLLALLLPQSCFSQGLLDFRGMPSGLIIPLDDESMYVRNPDGQIEIRH